MDETRRQILAELADAVVSESVRSVERLEDDGVDRGEAIRRVSRVLASITEEQIAQRPDPGRRPSVPPGASDERELGGES